MSEKKIFINPQAPSVATALISGVAGNPTNFPELFFGDAYEFVVKFTGDSDDGFIVPPAESFVFNLGLLARASAGTFVLEFDGVQTAPLPFDASAEDVANALNELETMQNVGGCEVTGLGGSPYRIIFKNYGGRSKIGIQSSLFPDVAPISYVVESGSENARAEQLIILKLDYVASVTDYTIDANAKELRFKVSLNTVECLLALGQADKVKLIAELKGISATGDVQTFVQIPATIYNRLIDVSALEYTIVELSGIVAQANAILEQFRSESAGITESIKTLSQVKSNRGELCFNNGVIATTQNSPLNTSFSYIWTWAVTLEEFDKHTGSYGLFGTTRYWSTSGDNADYGWAIGRKAVSGTLYVGNINFNSTGIVGGGYKGGIHSVLEYLDGNPHIWSVAYNGTNIKLRIDDNVIASYDLKFEKSESKSPFYVGWAVAENVAMFGRVSRIKGFNFDITSEDAPYSLADYIAGKDESPLLNLGGATTYNANANWLAFHGNEGTFDSTNNELTFTGSEATTAGYIVFYVNANIKAGAKVDVSIDSMSTNSSATFTNWQGVAGNTSGLNASGKSANTSYGYSTSFTTTADATNIGFWLWKTGTFTTGETLTLVKPQIKVNGALLSLADYSIQRNSTTKVVLDESGNGNVATITGNVVGSKDSAISAFIDELKMQITQTS